MGCIYRRVRWMCKTCKKRLDRVADRGACTLAGHVVEQRLSSIWWIQYVRGGKSYAESSESKVKDDARRLLQQLEGEVVRGRPITPKMGRLTFDDAAADLLADYTTNGKRSYGVVKRRVEKHLTPFFAGWRMANITTPHIRKFVLKRQTDLSVLVRKATKTTPEIRRRASNGEINRELALLKRMFTLAIQARTVLDKPHIKMLRESAPRTGFFEAEQYESVLSHLPVEIQPIISFAYLTGWRIDSEVLPLQWHQVDFAAGEVRLHAGTTKNDDGRVFPLTAALRRVLEARHAEHLRLTKAGNIYPYVFFREVAEGRGGEKKPRPVLRYNKAWRSACRRAGCPGRIPHDFRRTAIRNLVRAGIPERVAMQMTGHKTRSVFERYNIVSDGDLREAARKLDAVAQQRGIISALS